MIGSLRGRLTVKQPPQLLIEVGGVGYELEAPMSTFYALPAPGEEVRLLTHLVVREDAQVLYGFMREEERRLFRLLIKVSGVGPKIALAILSGSDADAFASCIAAGDTASLIRIPGVGRKTAERLILELRDRVTTHAGATPTLGEAAVGGPRGEALAALSALGYRPAEATRMVDAAVGDGGTGAASDAPTSTEEIIRRALQSAAFGSGGRSGS
jgi:Holliday junction DNA helicase RuvA